MRWVADLPGEGTSSPIVGRDLIFLTTAEGPRTEAHLSVLAVRLADGEIAWQTEVVARPAGKTHRMNTPAGATPATDGKHVYAYFGSHLAALDLAGEIQWTREIDDNYLRESRYGASSSLVLLDDRVIVLQDRETAVEDETGWLAAFAKQDGRELWRVEWSHTCCAYTTPLVLELGGRQQIFVAHAKSVVGYDPADGSKLWEREQDMNQPVASPVLEGDLLCTASGAHGVRETVCRRLGSQVGETTVEELWRTKRSVPATASPLLLEGRLYIVTESGVLLCLDGATGELVWRNRLAGSGYHASLVAGDGKLYATSTRASLSVVATGPEFELLAENSLPEGGVIASPAIADGCLLVRTPKQLLCIEGTDGDNA
jgi:outer membrane protein assembly factor BamB